MRDFSTSLICNCTGKNIFESKKYNPKEIFFYLHHGVKGEELEGVLEDGGEDLPGPQPDAQRQLTQAVTILTLG